MEKGPFPPTRQSIEWHTIGGQPKGNLTALINAAICNIIIIIIIIITTLLQTNGCHKFVAEDIKS
jgi:hypothetical protein